MKITPPGTELELIGAPEDTAGNTNSFLELLVDSSWNEVEGRPTLLELGDRELDLFA